MKQKKKLTGAEIWEKTTPLDTRKNVLVAFGVTGNDAVLTSIAELIGCEAGTARRHIYKLVNEGLIVVSGNYAKRKKYSLTPAGVAVVKWYGKH